MKPLNDPLKSVENIVQLPTARRAVPMPALQVPRAQPLPPVLFASWVSARDRAAAALFGGDQRLLVTGPAGTGKTVLIEHVARVLRAAGRTVLIQLADTDPAPPETGVTLFVDEADRLSATKIRQLFDESAGTVVLTGLGTISRRVASGTPHLMLNPLGPTEARDYIAQWLVLNGRTPAELDSQAVRVLFELSGGIPRLLSTLLAAGAWLAKSNDAAIIEAAHIQEAAELRSVLGRTSAARPLVAEMAETPRRRSRIRWPALVAPVAMVFAGVAIVLHLFPAETDRAIATATPYIQQATRWLRAEPAAPPTPPRLVEAPVPAPVPLPPESPRPAPSVDPSPEPAHTVAETPESPPAPAPAPAPVQAAPAPPTIEPVLDNKPQEVAPPEPAAAAAISAPPPAVAPAPALPAETIAVLLRRGREMAAIDDFSAARLLFLRAAEGGSPEAMFELGQTYDPAVRISLGGTEQADRAEALRWYRRAADKGNKDAERLLPQP